MGSESRAKWPLYNSTSYKLGLKSGYSTLPSYFANKDKICGSLNERGCTICGGMMKMSIICTLRVNYPKIEGLLDHSVLMAGHGQRPENVAPLEKRIWRDYQRKDHCMDRDKDDVQRRNW
ncbi:hypothetical protein FH972_014463 [Carpinus fangiana]|uniref:Uncharacterized protein n=1 Tax=Carpinus fangiana TaxID=176857 RepID=A0A5N6R9Q0_9ROSI|nr:hypothetical protein FH972_014463 [Carpinus fangiana]